MNLVDVHERVGGLSKNRMNASSLPPSGRQLFDELQSHPHLRLRVGEHVIDVGALRVVTRPDLARLSGKALAVLIELVRHCGATVTRGQLLDRVWAERVITPDVLTQAIAELRRAFQDDVKIPRYIETVPRVGYRLLAAVDLLEGDAAIADQTVPADASNDDAPFEALLATSSSAQPRPSLLPLWALLTVLVSALLFVSAITH